MAEKLTVRHAAETDLDKLAGFLASLFAIEKDFTADIKKIKSGLSGVIQGGGGMVFVAELGKRPIGMASAQTVISTAAGGVSILVEDVFISEDFRNIGAGKMLMEHIKNWGKTKGAVRMQLVTDKSNTSAIWFYKKLGWNESNMTGMYYYMNKNN
jgi:GNAT superfamily N-acetyltransferase